MGFLKGMFKGIGKGIKGIGKGVGGLGKKLVGKGGGSSINKQQQKIDASWDPEVQRIGGSDEAFKGLQDKTEEQQMYGENMLNQGNINNAQARGAQQEGLNAFKQVMRGETPSVAENQLRSGLDKATAGAFGLAASTRSGSGMGRLAAQNNMAEMAGDINVQAAELRAKEQADARDAYMSGATTMRAGDADQTQMGSQLYSTGTQNRLDLERQQTENRMTTERDKREFAARQAEINQKKVGNILGAAGSGLAVGAKFLA